jgi:uncharacterized protein YecT (DUF1311 family)
MSRQAPGIGAGTLLIAMLSASAHAEECKSTFVPPAGVQCTDPDADQIDYNCPVVWDQIEDCRLNAAYQQLLAVLEANPEQLAKLRNSQRAWLKFRDADVALVVAHYGEGGSLGRAIASLQRFKLTRARLRELEKRLDETGKW